MPLGLRIVFAFLCLPLLAGADVSVSVAKRFQVQAEGASYRLTSSVLVEQTFISQESTKDAALQIPEFPHAPIRNLHARFRGEPLDSSRISFFYPQSKDLFIESAKVHQITLPPDLKPMDTLSYSYEEAYDDVAFFPMIHIPMRDEMTRFELRVDHPAELQVDFDIVDAHEPLNPAIDRSSATTTSLVYDNLPRPRSRSMDPFQWSQAWVIVKITRDGKPVTPHTPEAFTSWYLGLLEPTSVPDARMRELLAGPLAQARTVRDKARILFDYVKTEIRYVADEGKGHAFLPHACTEVLDKKWGDCKDKARLLAVLARLHGIPIHMALLSTEPEPVFEDTNVRLFNHAICVLDDGGELFFMDPTAPTSELGDPPAADLWARAFVLDPVRPRYAAITPRPGEPDLDLVLSGTLDQLKAFRARLVLRHGTGIQAMQARRELNDKDFERYLARICEQILPRIPMARFGIVSSDRSELVLEAETDVSGFLVLTDQRVYVPSAPFKVVNPEVFEREKDAFAMVIDGPRTLRMALELDGRGLVPKAESYSLGQADGARLSASCSGSGGRSRILATVTQPLRQVPPEQRSSYLKFCSDYLQANRRLFILERTLP